ncbi:hypothetical protein CDL12_23865 [Handroanthus impetiginosus]|uniref:FAR1 domain-containing protein n=1 Tax=Handroanthus impetiginosus TaxID=429701 RepID=A0A2G9GE89_9LAMI|nr:hypothetical protein CDL12_23865 [Handroanthus impetiginosus]
MTSNFTKSNLNLPNHPCQNLESGLAVGQVVKSIEYTYFLYYDYAHAKHFSARKRDQHYFPCSKELQTKKFECSYVGVKDEKRSIIEEKREDWKVTRFVMEHNHKMVETDQVYLFRSSCNLSNAQKSTLEATVLAAIKKLDTYQILVDLGGIKYPPK